jgi:hypothetical protein
VDVKGTEIGSERSQLRRAPRWIVRATFWLAAVIGPSHAVAAEGPRFLIFHLDAVASHELDLAIAEGRVPNLEAAFAGGARLNALTLYPQGTEMLYPRLKAGLRNDEVGPIGWGHYDREDRREVSDLETFWELLNSMPRRSRSSMLYGVPYLDALAGAAMRNLPGLLEQYGVVEFFWFATDTWGHWQGRDRYVRSIERFDTYLGELLCRTSISSGST